MKNEGLERKAFEEWIANYAGISTDCFDDIRTEDPDEPYYHEDYDEGALKLITIAWAAWMARAKQEGSLRQTITELRQLIERQGGYNHSALEEEPKK